MGTYKIHITGIVQGVGFRPLVYNLANKIGLKGTVSNNNQGVIIQCNTCNTCVETFLNVIIDNKPLQAVITHSSIEEIASIKFNDFQIIKSQNSESGHLLITPDYGICPNCLEELNTPENKRFAYPFITCTNCGPRYSVIQNLPYDRYQTTMAPFKMCSTCKSEYNDPTDRRFYSQTNSCPECGISVQLYQTNNPSEPIYLGNEISATIEALKEGSIIAIKGIGGYMIMADALNIEVIQKLRTRKNRAAKPFALMVLDEVELKKHTTPTQAEIKEWNSPSAPIILFSAKHNNLLPLSKIAPGLNEVGVMKAYTPLHVLICRHFKKPLIATSANLTDSPIIYTNSKAHENLDGIADYILSNNRDIVIPQDDSVLRFTRKNQKITIRRSRGIAPNYFSTANSSILPNILAVGAMLKSAFSITQNKNIFVSQYLGATNSYDTQQAFTRVYSHLSKALQFSPEIIVCDKHPGYFSTEWAEELAAKKNLFLKKVQHHEAHFCAVLGENNLWNETVLGFIWDGTGLGNDGQIWGGETMMYQKGSIERTTHLPYQKHILGDKMVREPRISALSFFASFPEAIDLIREKFNENEWIAYQNQVNSSQLLTSSIGRLFDAVASILNICNVTTYHGEAAMLLEAHANSYENKYEAPSYSVLFDEQNLNLEVTLISILTDIKNGVATNLIAAKFHQTLAEIILQQAVYFEVKNIAFSGGVFQNKLLIELIQHKLKGAYALYFHNQLSPNDESIAYGQMLHYQFIHKSQ